VYLTDEIALQYKGMVYLITNMITGRSYIGKKIFTNTNRKKIKGQMRRKVTTKKSDWEKYFGSSKELQEDLEKYGKENFRREVLRLCKSKGELSYFEAKYQFEFDVLLYPHAFYNSHIMCHTHRNHVKGIK